MALYAADIDLGSARRARRTPHSVKVRWEKRWEHTENKKRLREMETYVRQQLDGYFRYDDGDFAAVFWFSDADAAFAFKMRWT